jgi:hypothetical protein
MFVSIKPFQPSVTFLTQAGSYPRGAPESRLLALHTDIRLSWKGLPGTNTLAYYDHS